MSYLMIRNSGVNHLENQKKSRYLKMGGTPQGPQYSGLEYDRDVPDDIVIGSPGGTSSTYHHWTKGMYGTGGSSNDIYGGDAPRYLYGEYGNMYEIGDSASFKMGDYMPAINRDSDPTYWKNSFPQVLQQYEQSKMKSYSRDSQPYNDPVVEGYESIEPADINLSLDGENKVYNATIHGLSLSPKSKNPVILFMVFLLVYVTLTFWAMLMYRFVSEKFNNGKDLNSWKLLIGACCLTFIMIGVLWFLDIPLVRFEELTKNPLGNTSS